MFVNKRSVKILDSLIRKVASFEEDNLVFWIVASKVWPDKRDGLWWEWPYKRDDLWWEWPYKRDGLWWELPDKRDHLLCEWPDKRDGLRWEWPYKRGCWPLVGMAL